MIALRSHVCGDLVDDGVADERRVTVGIGLQRGHPRQRLDDVVVRLLVDIGTCLAEAGDAHVDEPFVHLA